MAALRANRRESIPGRCWRKCDLFGQRRDRLYSTLSVRHCEERRRIRKGSWICSGVGQAGEGEGEWETRLFHADDTVARCRVCSLTKQQQQQQQQTRCTQKARIRNRDRLGRTLGHLSYTGRGRGMAVLKSNLSGQFVGRQASTGWSLPCLDLLDLPSSRAPCTGCPTASR